MSICRNCESSELRDLGFTGAMAPFFLRRVFRSELITRRSPNSLKRWIQRATKFSYAALARVQSPAVAVELQICRRCSFLQTKFAFPDEAIGRLYSDYRSESYNRERSHYEPGYAAVADRVGSHTENGKGRVEALTAWLQSRVDLGVGAMLDFGGADGRYLPAFPGPRFVYEISDFAPAPGVTRIANKADLTTYPYVQLSHVLEHVTQPLEMVRSVAAHVQEGGYLFVEVPQDLGSAMIHQLATGGHRSTITIHEHINNYSLLAVEKLLEASGLEVIAVEAVAIESPMCRQDFLRGLARRSAAKQPWGSKGSGEGRDQVL